MELKTQALDRLLGGLSPLLSQELDRLVQETTGTLEWLTMDDEPEPTVFPIDPELEGNQISRLTRYKANRDPAAVESALAKVKATAEGSDNLLYSMRDALRADATLGEISDALRSVFGVYTP